MASRTSGFEKHFARIQFGFNSRLQFYREFAALLRAGMAKTDAIGLTHRVASHEGKKNNEPLAIIAKDIHLRMQNGMSFSAAAKPWVTVDDLMVIEATENSANFSEQLEEYCDALEQKKKIKGTIIGGVVYPIFLFLLIYGMLIYFGSQVVPEIGQLLDPEEWRGPAAGLRFMGEFAENYAIVTAIGIVAFFVFIWWLLPRWYGMGRSYADNLPIFSTYRMYTGVSFMMSISALIQGGIPAVQAIERLKNMGNPYVKHRMKMIHRHMLNGYDLGTALDKTKTGWPDPKLNLSIKVFSQTQDLSLQLSRLAKDWLGNAQKSMETKMALFRNGALFAVFGVIITVVAGMYSLQDQIAQSIQAQ